MGKSGMGYAQDSDTIKLDSLIVNIPIEKSKVHHFSYKQLIIPGSLMILGIAGCRNDYMEARNAEIREELQEDIDRHVSFDDFSQFAPAAAVFALPVLGVKSHSRFGERLTVTATSYALMMLTVNAMKYTWKIERPDGTSKNSFPSGHTATAFVGAELLRREFAEVSPWIGVGGYVVAAGTGFFRMYNNRHWLTDVVEGAGIGILSTEAAYWLYPAMSRLTGQKGCRCNISVLPQVSDRQYGLSCLIQF